ncbi:unnamed protein product [Protopolystoma xenopodis]|uniref:Uncharacterized protein n=1 Tax=Protopolystoma xenopodis TaxID=117903 RepID=A0A3S5AXK7_9PLAT|nr:unnamed protein product [Protopolystoma xenopodis]
MLGRLGNVSVVGHFSVGLISCFCYSALEENTHKLPFFGRSSLKRQGVFLRTTPSSDTSLTIPNVKTILAYRRAFLCSLSTTHRSMLIFQLSRIVSCGYRLFEAGLFRGGRLEPSVFPTGVVEFSALPAPSDMPLWDRRII